MNGPFPCRLHHQLDRLLDVVGDLLSGEHLEQCRLGRCSTVGSRSTGSKVRRTLRRVIV
jgi:hypothetical protein